MLNVIGSLPWQLLEAVMLLSLKGSIYAPDFTLAKRI
jgi:hypothetical protein